MRSAILTYHSLDDSNSVISVPPALFRTHMQILAKRGTPVVPLQRLLESPGSVALTFDDGFRNFLTVALPELLRYGFPATVFAVTGHCGQKNDWPEQGPGIPSLDLLSQEDLQLVHREGVALGSHTHTHPHLTGLAEHEAALELEKSRRWLEVITGEPTDVLAYPFGQSSPSVRRLAGRYYRFACGTRLGLLEQGSEQLNLPRIDLYYVQHPLIFQRLLDPEGRWYLRVRRVFREARQWISR